MAPITYKQTEPAVLADGEADAHHAYASGMLDIAVGSPAEELARAVDATLEIHTCADGQDCAAMAAGRWGNRLAALVVNAVPPYRTDAVAPSVAKSAVGGGAVVVPDSRVMLAPTVAQVADHLDAGAGERRRASGAVPHWRQHHGQRPDRLRALRQPGSHHPRPAPRHPIACMLPQTRCLILLARARPPTT